MNWKSGLFRFWLVASACWIAIVAWVAYVDIVVPRLQYSACMMARQDACVSARTAHRELGNPFDCFDKPPLPKGLFDDLIPHYGWFGDLLPSCASSDSGSGSGLFDDIPLLQ
jgi:hypothetical protein